MRRPVSVKSCRFSDLVLDIYVKTSSLSTSDEESVPSLGVITDLKYHLSKKR
jgi:hypothetical protein